MTRARVNLWTVSVVSLMAVPLLAIHGKATGQDQPPAQAAADQAESTTLTATIVAVNGVVQVREAEDKPWKRAEPGAKIGMGAEFRTGMRSAVRFVIQPDQIVTLDRLGTIKVINAVRSKDGKVATDLGMKYGRTRYQVEAGGDVEHQTSISSPSAVLAVRGSDVTYSDDPLGTYAFGKGKLLFIDHANRRILEFGRDLFTGVDNKSGGAAASASTKSVGAGPQGPFGGLDNIEKKVLQQNLAQGGISDNSNSQIVTVPAGSQWFAGSVQIPGSLVFHLDWEAGFASTDLNLRVTSPNGDTITSLNIAADPTLSGGIFGPGGDKVAGLFPPNQPTATETGGWFVGLPNGSFPPGTHTITAVLEGGQVPASAALAVLRDGVVTATMPLTLDQQIDDNGVAKQAAIVQVTAE